MPSSSYVRRCPFCAGRPPYLQDALQCGPCGAARPLRAFSVTWHACPPEAEEKIEDALDGFFHSGAPENGKATLDVEYGSTHFRISKALISRSTTLGGPPTGPALLIAQVLSDAGIPVIAGD